MTVQSIAISDQLLADFAAKNQLSPQEQLKLATFLARAPEFNNLTHRPVGIKEFLFSPTFLNTAETTIYPEVLKELIIMNSGQYAEIVHVGGIGSAKSSTALYTQAYQLYLLSCFKNPHLEYALDPASEILIIFQNINATLAKEVDYERFYTMIENSPYFKTQFPFDRDLSSKLVFRNRIEVKPVSGLETAAIGQNVIGGLLDEVNFMAVIEESKNSQEGGTYDQATSLYNSIARRRKTRFVNSARPLPGIISLVSSRRYPGQFTDKKEEEAKRDIAETGKSPIYIYDKRVWDIKPAGTYSGEKFKVFIGDEHRKPRLMDKDEVVAPEDLHLVDDIPIEFLSDFRDDIIKALRDIAGRSSMAIHPFMPEREKVLACFGKRDNLFDLDVTDFVTSKVGVHKKLLTLNPTMRRWAHIDLGLTSDSAGVVIGHCPAFVPIQRGSQTEILPQIVIDAILEVRPPRNGEIEFSKIRDIFYCLRDMGLPLWWVSLDSYQSVDSMQILRSKGFTVGYQSVDKDINPYEICKQALYDGRVIAPKHAKLTGELLQLERNLKKNKIDHPTYGSKDISDALTGVVYGLTSRREVWSDHRVSFMQAQSITALIKEQKSVDTDTGLSTR